MSIIFGTNNPELADRVVLIRQIHFRDFCQLTPEMLVRFTERVEFEFGMDASEKLRFEFSPIVKRVILYYQNQNPVQSPVPTEQLSRCERNLQIIAKVRYFQWMAAEANVTGAERGIFLERIVLELKYWDAVYCEFLTAIGLPQPTKQEALMQIEHLINEFKKGESEEQIARIENFKQIIIAAFTQYEIKKTIENVTNKLDLFFKPSAKKQKNNTKKNEKKKD
ncbi:MAG: hypothetical protein LBC74_15610 [Planctomycetaceae bacterium]|nr:hypothetical protein [Planctomycetaceae bacterium]